MSECCECESRTVECREVSVFSSVKLTSVSEPEFSSRASLSTAT